jgi:hypothetical protein
LGVNETTARNWVADHLAEEACQTDPLAVMGWEFEELRPLRREVAELRTEREILRMAAASTTGQATPAGAGSITVQKRRGAFSDGARTITAVDDQHHLRSHHHLSANRWRSGVSWCWSSPLYRTPTSRGLRRGATGAASTPKRRLVGGAVARSCSATDVPI